MFETVDIYLQVGRGAYIHIMFCGRFRFMHNRLQILVIRIDVTEKLIDGSTPDLGQFSSHQRSYITTFAFKFIVVGRPLFASCNFAHYSSNYVSDHDHHRGLQRIHNLTMMIVQTNFVDILSVKGMDQGVSRLVFKVKSK